MTVKVLRPALVAAVAVATLAPAPATAGTADARLRHCTDTFALVEGDESAMRRAVPTRYSLGGQIPVGAYLWSISNSCRSIQIGHGRQLPGVVDFVGASIEQPDGGGDINAYLFWVATSHRGLATVLRSRGFPVLFVPGMRQTFGDGITVQHGLLDVPAVSTPYRIASARSIVPTHPHSHRASWWHDRAGRPRRVDLQLANSTENLSDCSITTTSGSRLARLLGRSDASTPCFLQDPTDSTISF